jgi:DNA-binding transcriptional LysR family regulator
MKFDLVALKTLVTAVDLNGFGKAAERLHRTPGAVSQQLKALEEKVGTPLFRKVGRQQVLTEAGELLVGFARRLLQLNDEAAIALRGVHLDGEVRFGMPQDFADSGLPQALARFARVQPGVRLDIAVDRSATLLAGLARGDLDLAIAFGDVSGIEKPLARLPIRWLAHPDLILPAGKPVPLLVMGPPCDFRQAAIDALDRAKRPWRIVMSSGSVSAIWAAAQAGLGVTARAAVHVPADVVVSPRLKLPALGKIPLHLRRSASRSNAAADHLHSLVDEVVRGLLE